MSKQVAFAAGILLSASIQQLPGESKKEAVCQGPHSMRADVRHIEASGIGYHNGYTTLEGFFAANPSDWAYMPFLDLRGHVFNTGKFAANAGIGVRTQWGSRVYGINGYYDYRNTKHRGYNQIALGLETLGLLFDVRVNGYLPVGGKTSKAYNIGFAGFQGNSVLVGRKYEFSMKGIDAEVGFHFGKTADFDFYAAIGPYYFKGEMGSGAVGGKARIAGYYKDYIALELSDSLDSVFHNHFQGQLTFSFPFGPVAKPKPDVKQKQMSCERPVAMAYRMIQPVARQEIVVVDTHRKKSPDSSSFFIFVDNLSSSAGTYESPYHTLLAAQNNSTAGEIIYVFPGDGTTNGMDSGIELRDNQKLWGSSIAHSLNTEFGSIYIPPQSTEAPTITNSGGVGITLGVNNEVSGLIIDHANTFGIYGLNAGDVSILSSVVSYANVVDSDNDSIYIEYDSQDASVYLDDLQIINTTDTSTEGAYVASYGTSKTSVVCSNSTFFAASYPIDVEAHDEATMTAFVTNNTLVGNNNGIYLAADGTSASAQSFTLIGNDVYGTIDDYSVDGEFSSGASVNLAMKDNNFYNNAFSPYLFFENTGQSSIDIENNRFNYTSDDSGLYFSVAGATPLTGSVLNNNFLFNNAHGISASVTDSGAVVCLDMRGNTSDSNGTSNYFLQRTAGIFRITPCNAASLNTVDFLGDETGIVLVQSCSSGTACP